MKRPLSWCYALFLLPATASAVEPLAYQTENGIDITPTLKARVGHDDNVRRTENGAVSSMYSSLSPSVIAQLETDRAAYQFDYRIDALWYGNSSADDYVNHFAHASAFWLFNIRNRLRLDYEYHVKSEPRGTGLTEGSSLSISEPLRYHYQDLNARYTYGAAGAPGRLVGVLGYESKNYNDVAFVRSNGVADDTQFYNWTQPYVVGEFYVAVSNYFNAVTLARFEDRSYDTVFTGVGGSRDSQNTFLYLGLDWNITGKTEGRLLVGHQSKDFDSSERADFSGLTWRLNLAWRPTDYSELRLEGRDYARNPDINANYVKDQSLKLEWEHQWTPLFTSVATARYGTSDYPGNRRKDDDSLFEASVTYSVSRWWDLSAGIGWFERDSTLSNYSYDQTHFFIGTEVSL